MKELKYVVVLTGVSVCCAVILGLVYQVTAGPIKETKRRAVIEGIQAVLPAFDNDPVKTMKVVNDKDPLAPIIYPAFSGEAVVGAAIKTVSPKGYAGNIVVMVGLQGAPDGDIKVYGTKVLEMKETPGLGTKLAEPDFAGQWVKTRFLQLSSRSKRTAERSTPSRAQRFRRGHLLIV
jgi:electron transport complex protein RnfG